LPLQAGAVAADTARLISALNHPLRRRILRKVDEDTAIVSARRLSRELGLPIGNVSYHLQVLAKLGLLRQKESRRVRGAKEFLYASNLDRQEKWFRVALEDSRAADDTRVTGEA
jgi:DNA-binding transcriptional ArsR family regulator